MDRRLHWITWLIIVALLLGLIAAVMAWQRTKSDLADCQKKEEEKEQPIPGPIVVVDPDEEDGETGWEVDEEGTVTPMTEMTPVAGKVNELFLRDLYYWTSSLDFKDKDNNDQSRSDVDAYYLRIVFDDPDSDATADVEVWRYNDAGSETGKKLLWMLNKSILVARDYDAGTKYKLREDFFWDPTQISIRIKEGGALLYIDPAHMQDLVDVKFRVKK
jgi:hypothetical protein